MSKKTVLEIESDIVQVLKNIYDPEIPVNVYDLGLIYEIDVNEDLTAEVTMTLTAPNCPVADHLIDDITRQINDVEGIKSAKVILTFDPPWDESMLSDEAKLELGLM